VLLFIGYMFSLEVVYWLTSNVCRQSLGGAASLLVCIRSRYVSQSFGFSQSLSVCQWKS